VTGLASIDHKNKNSCTRTNVNPPSNQHSFGQVLTVYEPHYLTTRYRAKPAAHHADVADN